MPFQEALEYRDDRERPIDRDETDMDDLSETEGLRHGDQELPVMEDFEREGSDEDLLHRLDAETIGPPHRMLWSPPSHDDYSDAQPDRPASFVIEMSQDEYDLIRRWPEPLPPYLLQPIGVGNLPNPFSDSDVALPLDLPLHHRAFPVLALTLSGTFRVPRRAVELQLQVVHSTTRDVQRISAQRARREILEEYPDASDAFLQKLEDAVIPDRDKPYGPNTLQSCLRQLGVDDSLIVHPQCMNHDCGHIFCIITRREELSSLPAVCPGCQHPCATLPMHCGCFTSAGVHCSRSWSSFSGWRSWKRRSNSVRSARRSGMWRMRR